MVLNIGDHVVVKQSGGYKEVPVGATGRVKSYYMEKYGVVLDGIDNPRSAYNCFYFKAKHLESLDRKEQKAMKPRVMEGNYRVVGVKFLDNTNGTIYPYACYDQSVEVGDICVVKSAHHGFGIAEVVEHNILTKADITREIVCKCDFSEYHRREATRKRMDELKELMQKRADALQELVLFEMLAKNDPAMTSMLNEYNTLKENA